jgi:methylmalonyl-CoA mutase C-terminal domain/subunit
LSGAHNTLFPQVLAELRKLGADDVPVIVGGVIPQSDIPALVAAGITAVFTPGVPIDQILAAFDQACARRKGTS